MNIWRTFKWYEWLILGMALLLLAGTSKANGDDIIQSNDNNAQTTGDVIIGDNTTRALSLGLGDVDINQCVYSKQFLIAQWVVLNPWCAADRYDSKGMHANAAMMRCSIKEVRKLYPSHGLCLSANVFTPAKFADEAKVDELYEQVSRHDDDDSERDEQYLRQQEYLQELESRLNTIEAGRRSAARQREQDKQAEQDYYQQVYEDYEKITKGELQ